MRSRDNGDLSAVTQVKVWSPEILHNAEGQGIHMPEANTDICDKGEYIIGMPGSKSAAGKSTVYIGTWENRKAPKGNPRQAGEARRGEGDAVVGLIHSRGVSEVMLAEDMKSTRRSQQYNELR